MVTRSQHDPVPRAMQMSRPSIPAETQKAVLLKSRRRCCLCFWLHGRDEVVKGQIAHLDHNPSNNAEDNLVFLCFDHHEDYDGTTRLAKGLRENEVRQWRDELYSEMAYRFRDARRTGFELSITEFLWLGPRDEFKAHFRLTNTGEVAVRSPAVTIRLPENVGGELPNDRTECEVEGLGVVGSFPSFDPWKAYEKTLDIFEPGGRVTIQELGGPNPVLLPGHSFDFEALVFHLADYPNCSSVELEYRVDGEEISPIRGISRGRVPDSLGGSTG